MAHPEWASFECENFTPGSIGALYEDVPLLTHAIIRPYVIAILLHRKAVRICEVLAALSPHCCSLDIRQGAFGEYEDTYPDKNRLEILTEEVLGKMVVSGLLLYNKEEDLWVLTKGQRNENLTTIVNWVSSLDAQLPTSLYVSEQNLR